MNEVLTIRLATAGDLESIMLLFEKAKAFMRKCGNLLQWNDGYPERTLMLREIQSRHCYVCCNAGDIPVATFCLLEGPDATYSNIYDGQWLDKEPYYVVHRLATDGSVKGAGRLCMEWCLKKHPSLRVDTHADNLPMQRLASSCGFTKCGRIRLDDDSWRIAYQHVATGEEGTIREVQGKDAEAINEICNYYIENSTAIFDTEANSLEAMQELIRQVSSSHPFLVFEEEGRVVGFCYAHQWKTKSAYARTLETTIYLAPAHSDKGIGTRLMNALVSECRQQGVHALIACITAENASSIDFHKKLGFTQVSSFKEVGEKFGRMLDVADYELIL